MPVVTEPKIAQNALKWAVMEMESRYKKLAKRGVRNLEGYNEQVKQLPIPGFDEAPGDETEHRGIFDDTGWPRLLSYVINILCLMNSMILPRFKTPFSSMARASII